MKRCPSCKVSRPNDLYEILPPSCDICNMPEHAYLFPIVGRRPTNPLLRATITCIAHNRKECQKCSQ